MSNVYYFNWVIDKFVIIKKLLIGGLSTTERVKKPINWFSVDEMWNNLPSEYVNCKAGVAKVYEMMFIDRNFCVYGMSCNNY